MPESAPLFDANVKVGKTLRWIDRNGRATIAVGKVTLAKQDGELIADAPLVDVWADVVRGDVHMWIGGQRYIVAVQGLRRSGNTQTLAGTSANLVRDIKNYKSMKEFDAQFMQAFAAEGGQVGKPPKA